MYEKEVRAATKAVRSAGVILKKAWQKPQHITIKENWHEVVTEADKKADAIIRKIITSAFPKHSFISEESPPKKGNEFTWYIDPLDGTTNFITHVPFFCSAAGLLKGDTPIIGAVYNPAMNELFCSNGSNAFLNGKIIHASKNADIRKTLVNYCHKNTPDDVGRIAKVFVTLKLKSRDLRRLGSGNLDICYVACGRNDAYFSSSRIWDIAPALAIARAAGCKITDWSGAKWRIDSPNIVITNGTKIHDDLIAVLSTIADL